MLKNPGVDASQTPPSLNFAPVLLPDVLDSMGSSKAWFDRSKMTREGDAIYPFVSRTRRANGIDGFFPRQATKDPEPEGAITLGLDTQTLGFQTVPFYTSQNIQVMRHAELDEFTAPVLMTLISAQMGKFSWGGNGATLGRLKRTRIMVPVMCAADGPQKVDWGGIRQYGKWLQARVQAQVRI
ncbi:hypothetical protein EAE32_11490 [Kocuria tytonicola]|uniref:Type I restriction modification DNA specificity domain-containing protein n=2 Tax=Kocuria tytonicola TaxID=2055946 RepID=A0A3L9KZ07_9MICC|nr:hypothetical protein EAE32_11490 [Kocuria tytonicola]